jgi:hypothetical protein
MTAETAEQKADREWDEAYKGVPFEKRPPRHGVYTVEAMEAEFRRINPGLDSGKVPKSPKAAVKNL